MKTNRENLFRPENDDIFLINNQINGFKKPWLQYTV